MASPTLRDRLAAARRNRRRFAPDARGDVGRAAELDVAWTLRRRLRGTPWRLHHGVRVPGRKGRREIDFVLTTTARALAIELKYWAGAVLLQGDRLVQKRKPPRGPQDHGAVLRDLAHKAELLERHHGDGVKVEPLLMFYDHRVRLDPRLAERPDVTTFTGFLEGLPKRPGGEPSDAIRALRDTLDTLGGWDLLVLHGGRVLAGDLKALPVEGVERAVDLRADRGTLRALFTPPRVQARPDDGQWIEVDGDAEVVFRPAGQRKPMRVALRHVLRVERG